MEKLNAHIKATEEAAVKFGRAKPSRELCLMALGYDIAKSWGILDEYKKACGWAFPKECR